MSTRVTTIVHNVPATLAGPSVKLAMTAAILFVAFHNRIESMLASDLLLVPAYMAAVFMTILAWVGYITLTSVSIVRNRSGIVSEYDNATNRYAHLFGVYAVMMTIALVVLYKIGEIATQQHGITIPSFGWHLVRD